MTPLVDVVVLLGMFVVMPLGLRLLDGPYRRFAQVWPAGAVPAGVSLWLPRGAWAAGLAGAYAVMTGALASTVPVRLLRHRSLAGREVALLTALGTPAVAGGSLVAERAGYRLFGFPLGTLSLTVAHFHFAGFAAALIAALLYAEVPGHRGTTVASWCVPTGTAIVLVGFFAGDGVEAAGAVVLTAGLWLVAWQTWRYARPAATGRTTRWLFAVVAVVPVATMLLAVDWSVGRATGLPHPSLAWMAATHGVANAVGFALCGLLAWTRLRRERHGRAEPRAPA